MQPTMSNKRIFGGLLWAMSTSLLLVANTAFSVESPNSPRNNQSMSEVLFEFGQPVRKIAAVGKPPVSRWRYHGYTVYFEGKRVITSVLDTDLYP